MTEEFILAVQQNNKQAVEKYLSQGVDINAKNQSGDTALIWAAHNGQTDMVSLLLSQGADPNQQDTLGNTALHWALANNHEQVSALLIQQGASRELKNSNQLNPLEFALIHANRRNAALVEKMSLMNNELEYIKSRLQILISSNSNDVKPTQPEAIATPFFKPNQPS